MWQWLWPCCKGGGLHMGQLQWLVVVREGISFGVRASIFLGLSHSLELAPHRGFLENWT